MLPYTSDASPSDSLSHALFQHPTDLMERDFEKLERITFKNGHTGITTNTNGLKSSPPPPYKPLPTPTIDFDDSFETVNEALVLKEYKSSLNGGDYQQEREAATHLTEELSKMDIDDETGVVLSDYQEDVIGNKNRWSLDTQATLVELPLSPSTSNFSKTLSPCDRPSLVSFPAYKKVHDSMDPITEGQIPPGGGMRPLVLIERKRLSLQKFAAIDSSTHRSSPIPDLSYQLDSIIAERKLNTTPLQEASVGLGITFSDTSSPFPVHCSGIESPTSDTESDSSFSHPVQLPDDISSALSSMAQFMSPPNEAFAGSSGVGHGSEKVLKGCLRNMDNERLVRRVRFDLPVPRSRPKKRVVCQSSPTSYTNFYPATPSFSYHTYLFFPSTLSSLPFIDFLRHIISPTPSTQCPLPTNMPLAFLVSIFSFLSLLADYIESFFVMLIRIWLAFEVYGDFKSGEKRKVTRRLKRRKRRDIA